MNASVEGHPVNVPHGLIHDWAGVLFISKVSLAQTLAAHASRIACDVHLVRRARLQALSDTLNCSRSTNCWPSSFPETQPEAEGPERASPRVVHGQLMHAE